MFDDINVLNYIINITKLSEELLGRVLKECKIENEILKNTLKQAIINYRKIITSAKNMLLRRNKKVDEIGVISKMMTYMSFKSNLDSESTIEDILVILKQNSKINIDEINRKLEESKIKSKSIINLANRLVMFEEDNLSKYNKLSDIK